jgi:hypothetical protein
VGSVEVLCLLVLSSLLLVMGFLIILLIVVNLLAFCFDFGFDVGYFSYSFV